MFHSPQFIKLRWRICILERQQVPLSSTPPLLFQHHQAMVIAYKHVSVRVHSDTCLVVLPLL